MTNGYKILRTSFFVKWFYKQSDEVQEKVVDSVGRIQQGNFSNCKPLRSGVSELKIHYGKGIRVYYTKSGETILILLHGGADKKQQVKDIERAVRIKEVLKGKI